MSWIVSLFGALSMRAWLVLGAVAAFALWSFHVYGAGYSAADDMWKARQLEAKIARLELELKIRTDADAAEDELLAELEQENEQQKKVIDAYLEELKNRPDRCLLGPDAGRLQ